MRKDLVVVPEDVPGVVAELGEVLGRAGINIEAISAFTGKGRGIVHVLVDRADDALRVLREAGFEVAAARRVVVVALRDRPGELGAACRKLADAGINIEQAYISAGSHLVVVCDDIERAEQILGVAGA